MTDRGPVVIDGTTVGPPPPVWTCPECRRTIHEGEGVTRATARMCGGDPVTGRGHPLTAMDRDPPTDVVVAVGPGEAFTITRTITLDDPDPVAVAVWAARMGAPEVSGGGYPRRAITWTATDTADLTPGEWSVPYPCCGGVDVDNPLRAERRHRRGCPEYDR